ncbi:MAG: ATP-dependent Clp protease adapter ClpS [Gammaproteobacteria bacterium TMED112]|nr:MAG: ATP-dependent Clp protease adapter ClpS [Gammaproteobacteria bacterium TMED112]|tara:strand:- start:2508 stop:2831 length:324 start_codon:yes stop_codon:yes gene_type:complete
MAQDEFSTGTIELEEAELKVDRPPLFTVVIFNDDFTPMEFVVYVVQKFFGYDHAKSTEIMLEIHNKGRGFCGAFSQEIAETKSQQINQFSKENEHPLKSDIEELGKD